MIPVGPSQDALLRLAVRVACATPPPGGGGVVWVWGAMLYPRGSRVMRLCCWGGFLLEKDEGAKMLCVLKTSQRSLGQVSPPWG